MADQENNIQTIVGVDALIDPKFSSFCRFSG